MIGALHAASGDWRSSRHMHPIADNRGRRTMKSVSRHRHGSQNLPLISCRIVTFVRSKYEAWCLAAESDDPIGNICSAKAAARCRKRAPEGPGIGFRIVHGVKRRIKIVRILAPANSMDSTIYNDDPHVAALAGERLGWR